MNLQEWAAAVEHLREAEAMALALFPSASHPTTLAIRAQLADALRGLGQLREGDADHAVDPIGP